MPENKHYIEVGELPDRIVALTTSELHMQEREYVSAELYESVCGANDAWQAENHDLRSLCGDAIVLLNRFCEVTDGDTFCPVWPDSERQCLLRDLEERATHLGVETGR